MLRSGAHRELREDPGDFTARHVLSVARPVPLGREALAGAAVLAYALVKGAIVAAVLQGSHWAATVGSAIFLLIAAVGVVALLSDPSPTRGFIATLDVAVAVAVAHEARRRPPTPSS